MGTARVSANPVGYWERTAALRSLETLNPPPLGCCGCLTLEVRGGHPQTQTPHFRHPSPPEVWCPPRPPQPLTLPGMGGARLGAGVRGVFWGVPGRCSGALSGRQGPGRDAGARKGSGARRRQRRVRVADGMRLTQSMCTIAECAPGGDGPTTARPRLVKIAVVGGSGVGKTGEGGSGRGRSGRGLAAAERG